MEGDPARPGVAASIPVRRGRRRQMSPPASMRVELTSTERLTLTTLAVLGAMDVAAGVVLAPDRMWAGLLLVSYYALGLALSALCFVAIHYTTGASWSVAVRRVAEA